MSAVSEPSGLLSVVISVFVFLFPAATLYTAFQGLAAVVMLQYSFQDLIIFPFDSCCVRYFTFGILCFALLPEFVVVPVYDIACVGHLFFFSGLSTLESTRELFCEVLLFCCSVR